jgi:hypothetical protein
MPNSNIPAEEAVNPRRKPPRKLPREYLREALLAEITSLPDESFVTARHAAAYLSISTGVLANWRSDRRGPEFISDGDRFVRYKVGSLRMWAAKRMKATAVAKDKRSQRKALSAEVEDAPAGPPPERSQE